MPRGIWNNYVEPSHVPEHSFLMFGADPCHTPAREAADPTCCPRCGGAVPDDTGWPAPNWGADDPVREYEVCVTEHSGTMTASPMAVVCGRCGRSIYDGTKALDRAFRKPIDPDTEDTDRTDRDDRTAEAVAPTGAAKGTIEYNPDAQFRDHKKRKRRKT
jgi:hypothetical protein